MFRPIAVISLSLLVLLFHDYDKMKKTLKLRAKGIFGFKLQL